MKIDKALISRLEHLARLELSDEERETILSDLNEILEMVEKLQELDTDDVTPLVYVNEDVNVWREDVVKDQVSQEAALSNAPASDGAFFQVPKVIDLKS
ncbi:MAG: aspartyl/glutamyl-tRNA(Asn/Gln) amidotransferase subunit C [Saprospiraceae bacterium]|nr:MAG: aspartyl/glutamyl-tRNA(Asn/Gln) amidotransferase subunit C [Saprospiraceae bacterium]